MDVKAFLELDTNRFKIQKACHKQAFSSSPEVARRYAETSGIDKLLKGRNQYPTNGFHTLLVSKIDS